MKVVVRARAKVNLHLSVGGLRPDTFHEITSVMQTIDLWDRLTVETSDERSVLIEWAEGLEGDLPEQPDLVRKALEELARARPEAPPLAARVEKRIPMAAGLGGGSADAAALLLVANLMLPEPLSEQELVDLAARMGSDVPFLLVGGTALVTGRGERVRPVRGPEGWWVLGISDRQVATAEVYRRLDEGRRAEEGSRQILGTPAIPEETHPASWSAVLHNDLAGVVLDMVPGLGNKLRSMSDTGALGATVTGSGPTIAGLCADEVQARQVAAEVSAVFERVEVCSGSPVGVEVELVERDS